MTFLLVIYSKICGTKLILGLVQFRMWYLILGEKYTVHVTSGGELEGNMNVRDVDGNL
jgi:hypothetical protein